MEIISNIALITINETMFIQVISFLIFVYFLNRIMVKPLKETMNERDSYLSDMKREIRSAEDEVESITRKIKRQERHVRDEAADIVKEIEDAANKDAEKIIAESLKEISDLNHKNAELISAVLSEARKSIKTESEILAQSVIEKVLNGG